MAKNNDFTIWQRLTKVFGPDSTLDQQAPVYNFDKKEVLKTTDKQEYEREKLQAQQTLYLGQQWQKIENNLYTQAVYYEPTRLASFYDYESMEYTPEISAALDIYAEESTTPDEDGHMLQIYSESKRIKSVLGEDEYLFLDGDDPTTRTVLTNPNTEQLKRLIGSHKTVFIDEAQRIENLGLTLKIIVDQLKTVQLENPNSMIFQIMHQQQPPEEYLLH